MSVVSINNAESSDPRSRPAKSSLATNLSAVVRWMGFQFGKSRSNLSVDLGGHVFVSVYPSSQIAKAGSLKQEKQRQLQAKTFPDFIAQTVRGVPFGWRSTKSSIWLLKATNKSKNSLPPISISICIVPLRLKVFRLRIIRAK